MRQKKVGKVIEIEGTVYRIKEEIRSGYYWMKKDTQSGWEVIHVRPMEECQLSPRHTVQVYTLVGSEEEYDVHNLEGRRMKYIGHWPS